MDAKKTGELIAAVRRQKGMNQSQLADKLGVTNKAISRWETGRGYPDVETLPDLAKALDLSVQELLDGEQRCDQPESITAEQTLICVCQSAGQQKRKLSRENRILVAILIILILIWTAPRIVSLYHSVLGSERCVVSADYSSLIFCGKEYVPLPMNGAQCSVGMRLVAEAKVTGTNFLMKLLFGVSLYEVKGIPDYEILYLQTDYDGLTSNYYVLASKYDQYHAMLTGGQYSFYFAEICGDDDCTIQLRLEAGTVEGLEAARDFPVEYQRGRVDQWAQIFVYEENHIFYYFAGELVSENQEYYWCPSVYAEEPQSGFFHGKQYYDVPQKYENIMEAVLRFA